MGVTRWLSVCPGYAVECTVVVFTDAYDVLYTAGADAIRAAFDTIGAPFVVSAECALRLCSQLRGAVG